MAARGAQNPELSPPPDADPDVEPLPRGAFRCRLCHVIAANRPSLKDHLGGKKHRRRRSLRAERRSQQQRSLFVSGFARGTAAEELTEHFAAFGEVEAVVVDKEKGAYAIVQLRDAEGRERALAHPHHHLNGRRLRVRPREQKEFCSGAPGRGGRGETPHGPGQMERELCNAADVDAQLTQLVALQELSEAERRLRHLLLTLFQEVFSEFFPGCAVLPFGSSVNGFDSHCCDLDLLLDLEATKSLPSDGSDAADSILSDVHPGSAPPEELLDLVASVLRRCVPGVTRVRPVPTARRPVVKFCHKQSGLLGDISIDNRLALHNTRFLRLCAEADARVRPLVYAVRLWAKRQGLAGNAAGGGPLLTNYALTLLVLFFLQTCSPPVLPTVEELRELAGPGCRVVESGWDCSFPCDAAALQHSTNGRSAGSLLPEFFHLFGSFPFTTHFPSLRHGRPLPLSAADPLLKRTPLTLPDPFELSHNVTSNVTSKAALRWGQSCRAAAKYCRSLQYSHKSNKGRPWGLLRLFQPGAVGPGAGSGSAFLIPIPLGGGRGGGGGLKEVRAAVVFVLRDVLRCAVGRRERGVGESEVDRELLDGPGCSEDPKGSPTVEPKLLGAPGMNPRHLEGPKLQDPKVMGAPGMHRKVLEDPKLLETSGMDPNFLEDPKLLETSGTDPNFLEDPKVLETSGMDPRLMEEGPKPMEVDSEFLEEDPKLKEVSGVDPNVPELPPPVGSKRPQPEGVDVSASPTAKRQRVHSPMEEEEEEEEEEGEEAARWSCTVWHRVWTGRRRLRRQLQHRDGTSRVHGDTGGSQHGDGDTNGLHGDTSGSQHGDGGTSGLLGDTTGLHGDGGTNGLLGDTSGLHGDTSGSQHGDGNTSGLHGYTSGSQQGDGDTSGLHGAEDGSELQHGDTSGFCGDEDPGELQHRDGDTNGLHGDTNGSPVDLDLEQKVTDAIVEQNGAARPSEPLLRFDVRVTGGGQRALLRLTPTPGPGLLFRDFFHFLRVFLPPMVQRRMGWGRRGDVRPQS